MAEGDFASTIRQRDAANLKAAGDLITAMKANRPAKPLTNAERDAERKRIDKIEERVVLLSKIVNNQVREIADLRATLQSHRSAILALQKRLPAHRNSAAARPRDYLDEELERSLIAD